MKNKKFYAGLILGAMSFITINSTNSYAQDRTVKSTITKEGKYVVEEYKQDSEEDFDVCEVEFTPEKSGVYSLTSTLNDKCGSAMMDVFNNQIEFETVSVDGTGKDKVEVNKKVYLEKGISYYVWVYFENNEDAKTFDFEVKCENDSLFKPSVAGSLVLGEDKEVDFEDVKVKGFNWNKETNTLTLDNCKLKGRIELAVDKRDFDFDSNKYRPVVTIDVKGKSSIAKVDDGYDTIGAKASYEDNNFDVVIRGEGKNKSKLTLKDFDSEIDFSTNVKLTFENINLVANRLWICAEDIYVNNSKMKFVNGWSDVSEEDDVPYHTVTEIEYGYGTAFCGVGTYFTDSNIEVEMEALPAGCKCSKTEMFIGLNKMKNTKFTVKGNKSLINDLKSGKKSLIKYPDKKEKKLLNKIKYKIIKSYRNGEKKGSIISGDVRYSKKYKTDVYNWDLDFKVVKAASTDGKLIGKVYVNSIYRDEKKSVEINDVIRIHGCKYKVVGISKNAFAKAKKLKKIVIKSNSIKKIGKHAFATKGGKKLTFVVNKNNKAKYKKLIKKSGLKKFNLKTSK